MKLPKLFFFLCIGIAIPFLLVKLEPLYVHGSEIPGSVDSSFSNFVTGPDSDVNTITTDADGKILIGGYFDYYNSIDAHAVARINQDGSLDTSFTSALPSNFYATHLEILESGKILVRGNISTTGYIYRLNSNGSLDSSFTTISLGMSTLDTTNFDVMSDGKIITIYAMGSVIRLNEDGTKDTSFTTVETDLNIYKILLMKDDSVLVVGGPAQVSIHKDGIIKLDKDGNLDSSFLNGDIGLGAWNAIVNVEVDSENNIWISGNFVEYHGVSAQNIAKLNPDGTLNSTFQSSLSSDSYEIDKLVIQPDGRILAGGYIYAATDEDYRMIVRLNSDGTKDTTFDSGYNTTDSNYICDMLLVNNNKLLIGGYFENYNGGTLSNLVQINLGEYLDINGPTGSISINSGATTTTTKSVTLTLNASDNQSGVSQMMVCLNSSFDGCSWESYKTSRTLVLDSNNGLKTVYVKYKDASGNISVSYMDTILLSIPEEPVQSTHSPNLSNEKETDNTDTTTITHTSFILKVINHEGSPIVGALVTLPSGDSGYTDSNGIVEFKNVVLGNQEVTISYNGRKIVYSTEILGTETYQSPSQIVVDETSDVAEKGEETATLKKNYTWVILTLLGILCGGVVTVIITRKKTS